MDAKQLHDFLFELYDYAEYVSTQIQPNNHDNNNLFMTLIYIEDVMDKTGRMQINAAATQAGFDASASLSEAHKRLDVLRQRIDQLRKEHDFNEAVTRKTETIKRDWGTPE